MEPEDLGLFKKYNLVFRDGNLYKLKDMNNLLVHYAKVLGRSNGIYHKEMDKLYTLKSISDNGVLCYQNGTLELHEGHITDFKIVLDSEIEAERLQIPYKLTIKLIKQQLVKMGEVTPESFLLDIESFVFSLIPKEIIEFIDHDIMWKLRKKRTRELKDARQIIMAAYYEAFRDHNQYPRSLANAGAIYGKDHATVLNSITVVNNRIDTEKGFYSRYDFVWKLIKKEDSNKPLIRHNLNI
jgi:hypothetical protein